MNCLQKVLCHILTRKMWFFKYQFKYFSRNLVARGNWPAQSKSKLITYFPTLIASKFLYAFIGLIELCHNWSPQLVAIENLPHGLQRRFWGTFSLCYILLLILYNFSRTPKYYWPNLLSLKISTQKTVSKIDRRKICMSWILLHPVGDSDYLDVMYNIITTGTFYFWLRKKCNTPITC